MASIDYGTEVTRIDGTSADLGEHAGKVILVVNTASKCGFTPQYAGLQALWERYRDQGLVVLGFPCDQFAHQEPGTEAEIGEFCQLNYGVDFPLHAKIDVNGKGTHALFQQLKAAQPGLLGSKTIKWNFTKFLVGRDGQIVARHGPKTTPESLGGEIEGLLRAGSAVG